MDLKHDWTKEELRGIHDRPLLKLVLDAAAVHARHHEPGEVQVSSLLSIKTGGCPEDCGYCPQAARYHTGVAAHKLLPTGEVLEAARRAKAGGASRFCMGAAWREVRDNRDFDRVLDMVRGVNGIGMEVCCTLGMLTEAQAQRLADAGLYAYNHNIDTSEEHYGEVIGTRTFQDRLDTLGHARKAGVTLCSGGIIGMGERVEDRIGMLHTLATLDPHPHSVPINTLVAVEGTPLADQPPVAFDELVRMVATARIAMPRSDVRLSAGRLRLSVAEQALCFLAGANSIFAGDTLLTTPNPEFDADQAMFETLGLTARGAFRRTADPRPSTEEVAHGPRA